MHLLILAYLVKFRDPASGLDCDLNINDRLGIVNSAMIKEYCDVHPFLRPLLYRIKEWAKALGLNSPSPPGGPISFSSYALTLMTISFLQARHILIISSHAMLIVLQQKEGHLPNLQEDLPPISKSDSKTLIWSRKPHRVWDTRFESAKDWVPPPLPDFDTLLSSWFSYVVCMMPPLSSDIIQILDKFPIRNRKHQCSSRRHCTSFFQITNGHRGFHFITCYCTSCYPVSSARYL